MKKFYVLKGLPGSGKSTRVDQIRDQHYKESSYAGIAICSTDHYWIRPDGQYDWNPKLLADAHDWCFQQFERYVKLGYEVIILDNTNLQKRHYKRYVDLATTNGYEVEEVVVGEFTPEACEVYAKRNVHNVPLEVILNMLKNWQP